MDASILFVLFSLLAGAMIPFQSAMNAQLVKNLQNPFYSALTIFAVAFVGLTIYVLIARYSLPASGNFVAAPKWSYLGGLLGAFYVLMIVICAPKLGIANVTVLALLGQILAAVLIEQFGLLHSVIHHITWQRVIGVIFMIAGVYLVKKY